jgi:OOP family OmpA-OmpF porin
VNRHLTLLTVAFAFSLLTAAPLARARDVDLDSFDPAPDQLGFTGFPSTRTPGNLGLDGTLWLGYGLRPVESEPLGVGGPEWVDHRIDATLSLQLGILSRGAVALRLPALLYQDAATLPGRDIATSAIGNPSIDARVRVLGAAVRPDGSVPDGAALALRGVVWLPLQTERTLFTDSATRAELSLLGDVETFGIGAGMALGYRYRPNDISAGQRRIRDQVRLAVGLRIPLPLLARAFEGKVKETVLAELDLGTDPGEPFERETTPLEARVAYRAVVGDVFLTAGVGAGLLGAVGSPDMRALVGIGYSPRKHDQDADGVPDGDDQCEHLPEDRDGFQDDDGCADDDNDGDLIVDEDDRCPMQAAEIGRDDDEDGCTD